ncbi:zinc ribbon domain-containing protein [Peribacillus asahii]
MSEKGFIKCGSKDAEKKEVSMTGTGLSKNI